MGLLKWFRDRQTLRLMGQRTSQTFDAAGTAAWNVVVDELGGEGSAWLDAKWRLSEMNYSPGNYGTPRPASLAEVCARFGITEDQAREIDAAIVAEGHEIRLALPYAGRYMPFLTVELERAQEWWDRNWASSVNPDGSFRSGSPNEALASLASQGEQPSMEEKWDIKDRAYFGWDELDKDSHEGSSSD